MLDEKTIDKLIKPLINRQNQIEVDLQGKIVHI